MIVWNDKIRKSVEIIKAVSNELLKRKVDADGVIEIFNNGIEQGVLLKVFDKYNPNIDVCVWAYLPSERDCNNQMKVLIGHHIDCMQDNMWDDKVPYKIFTQNRARDLHNEVRDYILEILIERLDKNLEKKTDRERS